MSAPSFETSLFAEIILANYSDEELQGLEDIKERHELATDLHNIIGHFTDELCEESVVVYDVEKERIFNQYSFLVDLNQLRDETITNREGLTETVGIQIFQSLEPKSESTTVYMTEKKPGEQFRVTHCYHTRPGYMSEIINGTEIEHDSQELAELTNMLMILFEKRDRVAHREH